MPSVELPVPHVVALAPELGHEDAAAGIDRQDLVAPPVGDEDARRARRVGRDEEAGREREHVGKQVPVGPAQAERVGGPVGEAGDGHRTGGDAGRQRRREGSLDEARVRTEAA